MSSKILEDFLPFGRWALSAGRWMLRSDWLPGGAGVPASGLPAAACCRGPAAGCRRLPAGCRCLLLGTPGCRLLSDAAS